MPFVAPIAKLKPIEERIIEFMGLNRKPVRADGEMSDMQNLTSDGYPMLTQRKLRGTYDLSSVTELVSGHLVTRTVVEVYSIITRFERVAMIAKINDNNRIVFIYQNSIVPDVIGITADTKMVAINTKICFFTKAHYEGDTPVPAKKSYLELVRSGSIVTIGSFGDIEAVAPSAAASLDVNTTETGQEIIFPSAQSIAGFKVDDAVNIVGTLTYTPAPEDPEDEETSAPSPVTVDVVASCIINNIDGSIITVPRDTFIELTAEGVTYGKLSLQPGSFSRTCPDMDTDTIIEYNNRLWGASSVDNCIYACKLGDPTNWQYYQTTSIDSYYAEQGTDGDFTGAAAYSQHLIFFKESSMAKVYGTAPANFQITNTQCFGLVPGEAKSVSIINDIVFYKSPIGLMAYEGGNPYSVSDKFYCNFSNVVCGTEGRKLYCSIFNTDTQANELMVCDIDKAEWHKEDSVKFRDTCTAEGKLYFINNTDGLVYVCNPDTSTENPLTWHAVFGPFDEYIENKKIFSRLALRLNVYTNSTVTISIKENDGAWEQIKAYSPTTDGGEYIQIVPRRCDKYSVKISGTGKCDIKSLTRKYRVGTGGV